MKNKKELIDELQLLEDVDLALKYTGKVIPVIAEHDPFQPVQNEAPLYNHGFKEFFEGPATQDQISEKVLPLCSTLIFIRPALGCDPLKPEQES